MVKTCADPFRCVSLPVEERNPIGPDDDVTGAAAAALQQQELGGLGRELILQGEKFDSLNAIIAQFCDPLRVNLEEVYRHPVRTTEQKSLAFTLCLISERSRSV